MAFVRAKSSGGRTYYYLVETWREGGRIRQRSLAYLGKYFSLEDALAGLPDDIGKYRGRVEFWQNAADECEGKYRAIWPSKEEIPRPRRSGLQIHNRLAGRYWRYQDNADAALKWAIEAEERLSKIQQVCEGCSAHKKRAGSPMMGTTSEHC